VPQSSTYLFKITGKKVLHAGPDVVVSVQVAVWLGSAWEVAVMMAMSVTPNAAGDSVYVGLDGQPLTGAVTISGFPPGAWAWRNELVETGQPAPSSSTPPASTRSACGRARMASSWTRSF